MSYPPRIQFAGALYHVTMRGVDRRAIVKDDVDRELWVALLARAVAKARPALHAWCLMTNHFHLLVDTPQANIAALMQLLNASYAQMFNRRHGRSGPLFQGRYHSLLIEREAHLLETARYIVLNPVRAGICDRADEWPWSSYRATAGLIRQPRYLSTSWLLQQFARDVETAQRRFAEFVAEGAPAASLAGLLAAA
jgi:putative transposase